MRNFIDLAILAMMLIASMFMILALSGCSPELLAGGAGFGGGLAASETIKGLQADLERREQALIARYNELVAAGAKADTLEELKQQINDMVRLKQTAEVAGGIAQTRWNDPAAAGGAIAAILATGYAWIKRRELSNTVAGLRSFRAAQTEDVKQKLDQVMVEKGAPT